MDEEEYLGEVAPRRRWTAALLTALHPALGYLYVGRPDAAGVAALAFFLYLVGFVGLWAWLKFFPLLPLAAFIGGWAVVSLLCLWGILRSIDEAKTAYIAKGYNHPMIYGMVYLFGALLPVYAGWFVSTALLWGVVQINDEAMYPSLLPGDVVLVDQRAWRAAPPGRGVGVVVARSGGLVQLGRVVGIEGDQVSLRGDEVILNQAPLPRYLLEGDAEDAATAGDGAPAARLLIEENDRRRYVIATQAGPPPEESAPLQVGPGEVLITSDNRAWPQKATLERVPTAQLLGQPRYIFYSSARAGSGEAAAARWERVGLRVE